MSSVDFTPEPNSFLWVVQHSHPNDEIQVGNWKGRAGNVARRVREMLDEIEYLRAEKARLDELNAKLLQVVA